MHNNRLINIIKKIFFLRVKSNTLTDVNDINEALADEGNDVGDEEIELSSMIKQMEIDQES